MRDFKFWSETEDRMLRTCIAKFESLRDAAIWACKKLDRTESSVYNRLYMLKTNNGKVPHGYDRANKAISSTKTLIGKKPSSEGVVLPSGFTFDITPKRVTMFEDHVRLYF